MNKFFIAFLVCALQWTLIQAQNIGISEVLFTPQSPLHIYKLSDGNLLQLGNSAVANTGLQIDMISGVNFNIINRQAGYLGFYTSNTERLRILSGGNVGIGTTAPTQRLHVEGNFRFSGAFMPNNNSGTNGQILVSHGAGAPPTWDNLYQHTFGTNNQGVNGTTDITLNSDVWTSMTGMSITFTPVHNLVYIFFTFSAYANPSYLPMQYVDFRVLRNGVSVGASNCVSQDYDDFEGVVTSFNGALNLAVPVTAGTSTTISVEWKRDGLYVGPVYCFAGTHPEFSHRSLIIID